MVKAPEENKTDINHYRSKISHSHVNLLISGRLIYCHDQLNCEICYKQRHYRLSNCSPWQAGGEKESIGLISVLADQYRSGQSCIGLSFVLQYYIYIYFTLAMYPDE